MKIPISWLKEMVNIPSKLSDLTDQLTMVGHMLDKVQTIDKEIIVDLELRGNRADCYSIYGIAREVAAIFGSKLNSPETLKLLPVKNIGTKLEIKTPLVNRAMIAKVTNVKITSSPKWLADKLTAYGMESINNIVDLTNYVMIETGEPMHAFDLDKLDSNLEIRLAKSGEKMTTFKNEVVTLTKDDLVWAMGKEVLSVAAAIGEKHHSISDTTTNILIEAANYDRANIRRSVYRLNLLTEAGIRHEKELDPNMVSTAITRFLYLIKKYKWGEADAKVYDFYPKKLEPWKVKLNFDQLRVLAGFGIDSKKALTILKNLGFTIITTNSTESTVLVPTHRTDVTLPEDLIEEILRIYGYDKIPAKTLELAIPKPITPNYIIQENKVRNSGASVGFNEAITLSFVKENLSSLNVHAKMAEAKVVSLLNPPSPDNRDLRISLLPNLVELTKKAIHERSTEVRLFEVGKVYSKVKGKYIEERKVAFAFSNNSNDAFVIFKSLVESFFVKLGVKIPSFTSTALLVPLTDSYELELNKKVVGIGGQTTNIHFIEIDLDSILTTTNDYTVKLWPKFPPQIEDITFNLPEKTYMGEVMNCVYGISNLVYRVELKDVFENNYTFNIQYQDLSKTLNDKEVEKIRNKILEKVKEKFGGQVKD